MKKIALSCSLLALCGLAQAQEIGQVLSRVPVYQQVAVPRQTCAQTVTPNAPTSGAGAVSGALTGAVLGTIIGEGRGAGALIGAVGGAVVGDKMESNANSQPVTTCTTQTTLENRLVGYTVVYEYAGTGPRHRDHTGDHHRGHPTQRGLRPAPGVLLALAGHQRQPRLGLVRRWWPPALALRRPACPKIGVCVRLTGACTAPVCFCGPAAPEPTHP